MILAVVLVAFGIAAAIISTTASVSVSATTKQDATTASALADARAALIGRAVGDNNRPGSLPCPDTNDDGVAETFSGSDCPSYIGRLPWRTLGLTDLRDGSGERLWYMLSTRFRDNSAAQPINTDTLGNVTVYSGNTSTTLTTQGAAVIFAPGATVGSQVRDTTANQNNSANYLESAYGVNNASSAGPYISTQPTTTFNDRLLVITAADLMTPVERRVASEILTLLNSYKTATAASCNCYPWADNNFNGSSNSGTSRGGVPLEQADPLDWGSGGIPSVPGRLRNNEWWRVIYYAIAPIDTENHTAGTLTINGVAGKSVVVITTGPAGPSRPSTNWGDYLDDTENSNNDNTFITPTSTAYARDRLYTIP